MQGKSRDRTSSHFALSLDGGPGVSENEWDSVFDRALRRVVLSVNHATIANALALLEQDDDVVQGVEWDSESVMRFSKEEVKFEDGLPSAEFRYFFYGYLERQRNNGTVQISFLARPSFVRATYVGQECRYSADVLGLSDHAPVERALVLGTAYLVKFLWHDYVHVVLQGISHKNYNEFRGQGRFQSDFAADNLATILLAKSYGLTVIANSLRGTYGVHADPAVIRLLRRNQSNKAFRIRMEQTLEQASSDELEWQYRRRLAVYISGWLLALGRAPVSLKVYSANRASGDHEIIVEVNGYYFLTDVPVLQASLKRTREPGDRELEREHFRCIAGIVDVRYRKLLAADSSFRAFAAELLQANLGVLGLDWGTVDAREHGER